MISPVTIAAGMVFVAAPDAQQVCALDAETGGPRWRYLLGGRVEVPPTIYEGLCLFGANDGWVCCLRAADGKRVWRFRAAPHVRRIMTYGRLESPWPVPGVLVANGVVCFAAGRHSWANGGVTVFSVDPFTGKVLWEYVVDRQTAREVWYDKNANDLLVSDGSSIFMCQQKFDLKTGDRKRTWLKGEDYSDHYLMSGQGRDTSAVFPFGFLYDRKDGVGLTRYHATHWYYRGIRGYVLAMGEDAVFGVAVGKREWPRSSWELFAKRPNVKGDGEAIWSAQVPAGSHGLLLSQSVLFVAGRRRRTRRPACSRPSQQETERSSARSRSMASPSLTAWPLLMDESTSLRRRGESSASVRSRCRGPPWATGRP
jgi:outer membrane protein assembly factor BamB